MEGIARSRRWRWVVGILLGLLGLTLAAGVGLYLLATWTPPPVELVGPPPTPESVTAAEATRRRLAAQVRPLRTRQVAPRGVTIELTEEEINLILRADPEMRAFLEEHGIRGARVRLEAGRIRAEVLLPVRGRLLYISAAGTPTVRDRQVIVELEAAHIGKLPAPEPIRAHLTAELTRAVARLNEEEPVAIRLLPGRLVVTVRRRS